MQAWILAQQGSINDLTLQEIADPKPQAGEVVLQVHWAALNPADRYLAEGLYPARPKWPHVLGRDAMGTIVEIGPEVANWRIGDKALVLRGEAGVSRHGTLAQRVCVPADCLASVPADWTDQQAACAALVYVTAWQALTQWGEIHDQVVLISGASGGVGLASVQLAKALGHKVIALSRSQSKGEHLKNFGADLVVVPALDASWTKSIKDAIGPRRVDLVIDNVGGDLLPGMIETLGIWGKISVVGMLAGPIPNFNTASLFFRRLRIGGVAISTYSTVENHQAWQSVVHHLSQVNQRPVIDSVFPMDKALEAFERLACGPLGKVLVEVAP